MYKVHLVCPLLGGFSSFGVSFIGGFTISSYLQSCLCGEGESKQCENNSCFHITTCVCIQHQVLVAIVFPLAISRVFHGGQKRTIRYDILFPVYIRNFFREDSAFKNNS